MNIVVEGTGCVGLSLAVILSKNNQVVGDIIPKRVESINNWQSPI